MLGIFYFFFLSSTYNLFYFIPRNSTRRSYCSLVYMFRLQESRIISWIVIKVLALEKTIEANSYQTGMIWSPEENTEVNVLKTGLMSPQIQDIFNYRALQKFYGFQVKGFHYRRYVYINIICECFISIAFRLY